jgi:mannose-6-phosphate isomerase-like protein (cupin superfamily)
VRKRVLLATLAASAAVADCAVFAGSASAGGTQVLAQGPVKALPPGGSFLSIVALPQPAGGSLGPHAHFPGFVYVLSGKAAIVENGTTTTVNRGEGHFIPALAVHTHKNSDDRLPAGALAVGLVTAVIVLLVVALFPRVPPVLVLPVVLAALIAGGAVALWNPWKNDWFFIAVRPEATRGAPMPIPSASDTYASPRFSRVRPGPYVESLATTTVDPHGQVVSKAPGPVGFFVLDGRADVSVGNGTPIRLGHHQATLVQAGESFRILNPSGSALRLLRFALTPKASSP